MPMVVIAETRSTPRGTAGDSPRLIWTFEFRGVAKRTVEEVLPQAIVFGPVRGIPKLRGVGRGIERHERDVPSTECGAPPRALGGSGVDG